MRALAIVALVVSSSASASEQAERGAISVPAACIRELEKAPDAMRALGYPHAISVKIELDGAHVVTRDDDDPSLALWATTTRSKKSTSWKETARVGGKNDGPSANQLLQHAERQHGGIRVWVDAARPMLEAPELDRFYFALKDIADRCALAKEPQ